MGTLALIEFLTVDGVMHGGWGAPYAAAIHEAVAPTGLGGTTAYLFGRRTYEKMAAFWPRQSDDDPMARHLNATPKYVASRTLTEAHWAGTRILPAPVPDAVRELKAAEAGDVAVLGSGVLGRDLMAAGLVDEYRLFIHPLLLGAGKRLFGALPSPQHLELWSVAPTGLGTVALVYRVHRTP